MFDDLKFFDRLNTDSILKFLFTVTIVFDEPFLPWPVRENLALGIHHVIISPTLCTFLILMCSLSRLLAFIWWKFRRVLMTACCGRWTTEAMCTCASASLRRCLLELPGSTFLVYLHYIISSAVFNILVFRLYYSSTHFHRCLIRVGTCLTGRWFKCVFFFCPKL